MPNRIVALVGSRSLGDTLCSIPTIKHLHNIYNKNIHVFTYQKELLKNYPYITLVDDYNINNDDILIETFRPDIFTHTRVDIRQIHALSSGFQLLPNEMEIKFYPDKYKNINKLPMNYVVIHPSKSWPSRSWEKERWQNLINKLNEKNIPIVAIGKDSEESGTYNIKKPIYKLDIKNGLNLINKLNIHQTWHVLNKSQLVITMDSGIFCSSDMKYNIKHNNDHKKMPPVAFCLERPESIGKDEDPDPNIYKCHPNVDKVFREIIKHYNFPNKGKIKL
jgi:ADP-heptose:LPS heptosyltransferase